MNLFGLMLNFVGAVFLVMSSRYALNLDLTISTSPEGVDKKKEVLRIMKRGFYLQAAGFLLQSFSIIWNIP